MGYQVLKGRAICLVIDADVLLFGPATYANAR